MAEIALRFDSVSEELTGLLRRFMLEERLSDFYLVGGTALALHFGHRQSVDLDLFTHIEFDAQSLNTFLSESFGLKEATTRVNTVTGVADGIRVDFIAHSYPMVVGVRKIDGIRLLAIEDIAAMKLNAIANRGSKKDFWDYHELLRHFSRAEILSFHSQKYLNANQWSVEKSLSYFDDAEADPDPVAPTGMTWERVKREIAESNRL